ncbi:hypothetical protein [Pseudoalteromonas sp. SG43-5]|uniref:hypothetical protein n=1 Tax=Pseudoalteromonas sp. SG43-5 TaxID=2760968 RepID=UPI001602A2AA|nr:hypothetical protein [Pseudoalteromonas sp. SG43-5]MBB1454598.1 hypothetical protein [Pseudoalteromonas sp. SG43-5]
MKDYQPFSAKIKSEIIDEIKNNFGHIYSDELISTFIKIMEESTFVELDFADLLAFLNECRNGFKVFTTQQALTEFVKSSERKPTSLFGHKKLATEVNVFDSYSQYISELDKLVVGNRCLYVSSGVCADLSEQQQNYEFYMVNCKS